MFALAPRRGRATVPANQEPAFRRRLNNHANRAGRGSDAAVPLKIIASDGSLVFCLHELLKLRAPHFLLRIRNGDRTAASISYDTPTAELIAERLTGNAAESYTNAAMAWGTEKEPEALAAYQEALRLADLPHRLHEYDAIIVRSASKLTREIIEAAKNLKAVAEGTELSFVHDRFFDEQARINHERGWALFFSSLDRLLTGGSL